MSKLTLFLLCLFCSCCGNEFRLHIHVKNLPEKSNPLLLRIYNGNTYVLDSLPSRQKDLLSFQIPASTHTGMFRLILNPSSGSLHTGEPTKTLDILFNKAAINLSVDYNDPSNSIQVLQSPENKIYFDFQKKTSTCFTELLPWNKSSVNIRSGTNFIIPLFKLMKTVSWKEKNTLTAWFASIPVH